MSKSVLKSILYSILIGVFLVLFVFGPVLGSFSKFNIETQYNEYNYPVKDLAPALNVVKYDYDLNNNKIEDSFESEINCLYQKYENEEIEVMVTLRDKVNDELLDSFHRLEAKIKTVYHIIDAISLSIDVNNLDRLAKCTEIEMIYSKPNMKLSLSSALKTIKADSTSLSAYGFEDLDGSGVTIAIIDTGINTSHPSFQSGKIIAFKDFIGGLDDLDPTDGINTIDYGIELDDFTFYHGTVCAGCAAGNGGATGNTGVAPGAFLIGVAAFDVDAILSAIEWCIDCKDYDFNKDGVPDGPDIISMSLGVNEKSFPILESMCEAAVDAGIIFVTSAGNDGPNSGTITSPGGTPKLITVGAVDDDKNIWVSSSRGPGVDKCIKPDVCAPGVSISVAYPPFGWVTCSGTSASCPIVAGVCALLLQKAPYLTPTEVQNLLRQSAEDRGQVGPDNTYGWGVVNTIAAIDYIFSIREIIISKNVVIEDETINFSATVSGNIILYEWDFDGDGDYDWESTITPNMTYNYSTTGIYQAELRINDINGNTKSSTVEIIVKNVPPRAKITVDLKLLKEDDDVVFNGDESWDTPSDQQNLNYSWDFGDGNCSNWLESSSITHSYSNEGSYAVTLTVKDDDGRTDEDRIIIEILNVFPIADAGYDKIVNEDELVVFNGNQSYDSTSDKAILKYTWNFGDGVIRYGITPTHTYLSQGNYTVTLTVKDDNGKKDKSSINVQVINVRPSVVAIDGDKVAEEDEEIQFQGTGLDTPSDLKKLEYRWDFGDNITSKWLNTPNITHAYTNSGLYFPSLEVRDDDGEVNFSSIKVEILNVPPTCIVKCDKTKVNEDESVKFACDDYWDTESDIDTLQYHWDFGDDFTAKGKFVDHSFAKDDTYNVKLTIIDDDDAQGTSTIIVFVTNVAPKAIATYYCTHDIIYWGDPISFNGSKTQDTISDLPFLEFQWDFGDGEYSHEQVTEHKYKKKGEYKVRLTVTDDNGAVSSTTLSVFVCENKKDGATFEFFNTLYLEIILFVIMVIIIILLVMKILIKDKNKKSNAKLGSVNLAQEDIKQSIQPVLPPKIKSNENIILSSPEIQPTSLSPPLPNQMVYDTQKQQTYQSNLLNTQQSKLGETQEYNS